MSLCLINETFSEFLFSYQIISHATTAIVNVCVAVVFYMHVYIFPQIQIFVMFYFLQLLLIKPILSVTLFVKF